eukprot:COSAG06_NODE_2570_length_6648_cov_1.782257_8_plen_92_part_00
MFTPNPLLVHPARSHGKAIIITTINITTITERYCYCYCYCCCLGAIYWASSVPPQLMDPPASKSTAFSYATPLTLSPPAGSFSEPNAISRV